VRTPLIVKLPKGRHAGLRVRAVTRGIDLAPTILDLAGLAPLPAERGVDGVSLEPFWANPQEAPRLDAVSEGVIVYHECKALRTARRKLILTVDAEEVERLGRAVIPEQPSQRELYDLSADPGEKDDLLRRPSADTREIAAKAEERLRRVLSVRPPAPGQTTLDGETIEGLKALGYAEEDEPSPARDGTAPPRRR
jgi:arylsulfatase A-like enzyme